MYLSILTKRLHNAACQLGLLLAHMQGWQDACSKHWYECCYWSAVRCIDDLKQYSLRNAAHSLCQHLCALPADTIDATIACPEQRKCLHL